MREICIIFFDKDGIYADRSSDDGLIKAYNHISSNVNSKEEFDFMMKLRRVIKNRGLLYLTNKNSFSSLNLISSIALIKIRIVNKVFCKKLTNLLQKMMFLYPIA